MLSAHDLVKHAHVNNVHVVHAYAVHAHGVDVHAVSSRYILLKTATRAASPFVPGWQRHANLTIESLNLINIYNDTSTAAIDTLATSRDYVLLDKQSDVVIVFGLYVFFLSQLLL